MDFPIHPKAVAFDLDGTLLDHSGRLDDAVVDGVRRIGNAGITVFIVTGRLLAGAERFWRALGLSTPLACCNGSFVGLPGEEPIHHTRLADAVRRKIVGIDAGSTLHFNYAIDNEIYSLKDGAERKSYAAQFCPVFLAPDPQDILARNAPTKCLCITPEADQPGALAMLREALGDGAEITTSNKRFIEIMPPGVNQAIGIGVLAEWLGTTAESFVAVGDAANDLPMLKKAGTGVSFTSSDPCMAEHADILLPQLWEGGMDELVGRVLGIRE
jgi:Cof subfamily protein (haloacid dehalogenase superfamily)